MDRRDSHSLASSPWDDAETSELAPPLHRGRKGNLASSDIQYPQRVWRGWQTGLKAHCIGAAQFRYYRTQRSARFPIGLRQHAHTRRIFGDALALCAHREALVVRRIRQRRALPPSPRKLAAHALERRSAGLWISKCPRACGPLERENLVPPHYAPGYTPRSRRAAADLRRDVCVIPIPCRARGRLEHEVQRSRIGGDTQCRWYSRCRRSEARTADVRAHRLDFYSRTGNRSCWNRKPGSIGSSAGLGGVASALSWPNRYEPKITTRRSPKNAQRRWRPYSVTCASRTLASRQNAFHIFRATPPQQPLACLLWPTLLRFLTYSRWPEFFALRNAAFCLSPIPA